MSAAALLFVATMATAPSGQAPQTPDALSPLVLTVTYEGGRAVPHVVTARPAGAWAPMFPKAADWRSPDGLAVSAINYKHVIEGTGVRVEVSLFLGEPHQREVRVANLLVEPDQPVTVEGLSEFGVKPVVLSVGPHAPPALYSPQIQNDTSALQVEGTEITADSRPSYRVTVRNLSSKPIMTFHVQTYHADQKSTSGRQGNPDGTPVVLPAGTYTFRVHADRPRDMIRITGLMFEDGTVEGDPEGVRTTRLVYLGRRLQLLEVLPLFREAATTLDADPTATIATLTARVDALPVLPDPRALQFGATLIGQGSAPASTEMIEGAICAAMLEVRRGVLSDLQSAPREREAFRRWFGEIAGRYAARHRRFVELTAR